MIWLISLYTSAHYLINLFIPIFFLWLNIIFKVQTNRLIKKHWNKYTKKQHTMQEKNRFFCFSPTDSKIMSYILLMLDNIKYLYVIQI